MMTLPASSYISFIFLGIVFGLGRLLVEYGADCSMIPLAVLSLGLFLSLSSLLLARRYADWTAYDTVWNDNLDATGMGVVQ